MKKLKMPEKKYCGKSYFPNCMDCPYTKDCDIFELNLMRQNCISYYESLLAEKDAEIERLSKRGC